ncbi:MAG: acyltransferase [Bacteroidales bacterium]|jgi:1-acyl-sn-glycerol-3-phosphate acyltransferase|nr:acyltransferase [Bacteroidales bacterium]
MKNPEFDDLRPYRDEEIPVAMRRIVESEYFPLLAAYVYPDRTPEDVKNMLKGYTTIYEFQSQVMKTFNEQVIARSTSSFSCSGIEQLDKAQRYLFVSNHRDIMLDSSLLQYALHCVGHPTTEITFGSNLMDSPLAIDIGKSNKMFKVIRSVTAKEFYANSLHLSAYIYHALQEKHESIWIAQRNGRTKDGIDATDQGIIKMFHMSRAEHPAKALAKLNIVPVAVSYLWEPCDLLKATELCSLQRTGSYMKKPGEDLNSILTGIHQFKGSVHFAVGKPITEADFMPFGELTGNKFNKQVALLIDSRIRQNYRLTCNNYIACDMLSKTDRYAAHYTDEEKALFAEHFKKAAATATAEDRQLFSNIFLGIYAHPVSC